MSNLPGNPFAETHTINGTITEDDGDWATAQATLALAYEQRTANLLEVLELQGRMHDAQQAFNLSAYDVAERLGLGENNE